MLWPKKQIKTDLSIACCLNESSYSLAVIANNKRLLFSQARTFSDNTQPAMPQMLADDIERFNLIAHDCQLILIPGQYQLILMDAPDVPEIEMAKALRWNLKGLADYDLDDVVMDAFMLPTTEDDSQKKVMVAITPLSGLNKQRALLESAFLDVAAVSIAEIALKNLLDLMFPVVPEKDTSPLLVITLCGTVRKLHIVYNNLFYLIRELTQSPHPMANEPSEMAHMILELERSIDYCVNQLSLPEPKQILFTPGFHQAVSFFKTIEEQLAVTVSLIDLNHYLDMSPALSLAEQHLVFYSIAGAIRGTRV